MSVRREYKEVNGKRYQYWVASVQVGGKRARRRFELKKDAQEWEAKTRAKLKSEQLEGTLHRVPSKTFGEAMLRWIKGGAPKSMYSHIRQVRPHMEYILLRDAVSAAEDMKASMLADGLNVQTVNRRLAVVRRVLNLAYEWGWLSRKPVIKLASEKKHARHVYLSQSEVLALAKESGAAGPYVLLLAFTGLRVGELFKATKSDGYVILGAETKGEKPRIIKIVDKLSDVPVPPEISRHTLENEWKKAKRNTGMGHVRLHDLRHTFASWLIKEPGIPLAVVRDLLGHSSLSVTSRYAHLSNDALDSAIDKLG